MFSEGFTAARVRIGAGTAEFSGVVSYRDEAEKFTLQYLRFCLLCLSNNRPGFNSLLGFYSREACLVCYCSSPPGGHPGNHVDASSSPLQTESTQDLQLIDEFSGSYFC